MSELKVKQILRNEGYLWDTYDQFMDIALSNGFYYNDRYDTWHKTD